MRKNDIFATEQKKKVLTSFKWMQRPTILIVHVILENCHNKRKNLSSVWIDYKKAFDRSLYSWILKSLDIFNISHVISNFLKHMSRWDTNLHSNQVATTKNINIIFDIFPGNSLSSLIFCVVFILLTDQAMDIKLATRK